MADMNAAKRIETPDGLPNQVLDLEERANMLLVSASTSTNEVKLENAQEETLIDFITEVHPVPVMDDKNHETEIGTVQCSSSGNDAVQKDTIIIDDCPVQHSNQDHPDADGKRQFDVDLISGTKSLMQGEKRDFDMKGDTIPLPGRKYHPSVESVTTFEHSMQEGTFDIESVDSDAESLLHDKQKVSIDGVQKISGADDEQRMNLNDDFGGLSTASMSQVCHQNISENCDDHAENLFRRQLKRRVLFQMVTAFILYFCFCGLLFTLKRLFPFIQNRIDSENYDERMNWGVQLLSLTVLETVLYVFFCCVIFYCFEQAFLALLEH